MPLIKKLKKQIEQIDYISFVPDGEPTLDINLGKEIKLLKTIGIRIAIISNASLLWRKDVQDDISNADYVSLKIDTVNEKTWNKINKPHSSLNVSKILSGIIEFSKEFNGNLVTETMIIKNLNDNTIELEKISDFILKINSNKSYISIPTRPPAEEGVEMADEFGINMAYQIFKEKGINTEFLTGYEGNKFAMTGNFIEDLLSITSVHPMREEGVKYLLSKTKESWDLVKDLIMKDKLIEVRYKNKKFYIRKLPF